MLSKIESYDFAIIAEDLKARIYIRFEVEYEQLESHIFRKSNYREDR